VFTDAERRKSLGVYCPPKSRNHHPPSYVSSCSCSGVAPPPLFLARCMMPFQSSPREIQELVRHENDFHDCVCGECGGHSRIRLAPVLRPLFPAPRRFKKKTFVFFPHFAQPSRKLAPGLRLPSPRQTSSNAGKAALINPSMSSISQMLFRQVWGVIGASITRPEFQHFPAETSGFACLFPNGSCKIISLVRSMTSEIAGVRSAEYRSLSHAPALSVNFAQQGLLFA